MSINIEYSKVWHLNPSLVTYWLIRHGAGKPFDLSHLLNVNNTYLTG